MTAPLRAFACHPHTQVVDLCLSQHQFWAVVDDETDELVVLVPFALAVNAHTLRKYLRLCDYRGTLTIDDA